MKLKKRTKCKDGFSFSQQASSFHYCEPRDDEGPYTHFELGYPSDVEELLMDYAEDQTDPTRTVYARVPQFVIDTVIEKHGGLA